MLYRGQRKALAEFLPLDAMNWITCGNALRIDWRSICPPTGTGVRHHADDLFHTPIDQAEIDFENEAVRPISVEILLTRGASGRRRNRKLIWLMPGPGIPALRRLQTSFRVGLRDISNMPSAFLTPRQHLPPTAFAKGSRHQLSGLLFSARESKSHSRILPSSGATASHNAGVTVIVVGMATKSASAKKPISFANVSDGPYLVPNRTEVLYRMN